MRAGVLTNIGQLCRQYQGPLEVARGPSSLSPAGLDFIGSGGQVRVSGTRPEALLALGLTLYFSELGAVAPATIEFGRALERVLGVPRGSAALGLFVNAPGSGLPMHHDSHDQLFFQLSGNKKFTYVPGRASEHPAIPFSNDSIAHTHFGSVYEEGFPEPHALEVNAQTLELAPGSCFFMPAGTLHRTLEQTELCVSLTVAVRPPAKVDLLLGALEMTLLRDSRFRAPSYGYFAESTATDGDQAEEQERARRQHDELDELRRDMAQALDGLDPAALTSAWRARQHREGVLSKHEGRPFVRYLRVPSTRVRVLEEGRETVRYAVRPANSPEELGFELAKEAAEVVEHVLGTHRAITVIGMCEAFEQFEEEDIAELLDQLCRVGLLRPLPHR